MLYREIIAVCSQIHTKHINTLCGQNAELFNAKPGGTYSDHWALILFSCLESRKTKNKIKEVFPPGKFCSDTYSVKRTRYVGVGVCWELEWICENYNTVMFRGMSRAVVTRWTQT